MTLRNEGAFVTDYINDNIFAQYFVSAEKIRKAKNVIRLWGNVRERLNLYGWKLCLKPDSPEGFCWHIGQVLDVGLKGDDPRELLLHEAAHIDTARFCNNRHTWDFWKKFVDYMERFMPGQPISQSQINHMMYGSDGHFYGLCYDSKAKR
jgi:hypothetical protein